MNSTCAFLLVALAACSSVSATPPRVQEVPIPPRTQLFFAKDNLTWATFLQLRADGRYRQITAEHFSSEERDRGRWSSRGGRIWLQSNRQPRDIQTPEFVIYISNRAALRQLPRLREAVATLLQGNAAPQLPIAAIEKLSVPLPRSQRQLKVDFDVGFESDAKRRGFVKREALQTLLQTIDNYLAGRDQFTFAFRLVSYRGVEWLEPVPPNDAYPWPVADLVRQVKRSPRSRPHSVYVRVPEREFAEGAGSLYPFKFYPEMNEKLRGLQPKRLPR